MIYFVTFGISTITSIVFEYIIKKSSIGIKDVRAWLFPVVSVLAVSILNGIRDYSIGTDIQVYGNSVFLYAVNSHSLIQFIYLCVNSVGMTELGYALLNYAIAQISTSPHVFYFILGLLTNAIIYCSIVRMRDICGISLAWMTYLFIYYATTLNLLRQSLAIAIIFLMSTFALRRKYIISICLTALAYSFHHSAIFGLYLLFFIWYYTKEKKQRKSISILMLYLATTALLPFIIGLLNSSGYLNDKYTQYLTSTSSSVSLINSVLIRLPFIIGGLYFVVKSRSNLSTKHIIYAFIIGESFLIPLQLISAAAFRISLYFGVFKIIAYPSIIKEINIKFGKNICFISYLIFYFTWMIIIQRSNQVYPFLIAPDLSLF